MKNTHSKYQAAILFWCLVFMLAPVFVYPEDVKVYIFLSTQNNSANPEENIVEELKNAIERHNLAQKKFFWIDSFNKQNCDSLYKCLYIEISRAEKDYILKLLSEKKVQKQSVIVTRDDFTSFDLAKALAVKINLLVDRAENIQAKPERIAIVNMPGSDSVLPKEDVLPAENPLKLPEKEKVPTVEQKNPLPDPKAPVTDKVKTAKPVQDVKVEVKIPVKKKKIVHLEINPSFLTGFTNDFNTGGLELGVEFMIYRQLSLRLDIGYCPYGTSQKVISKDELDEEIDDEIDEDASNSRRDVNNVFMLLPIAVSAGYRNDFSRWYFGAFGGLYMMQVWGIHKIDGYTERSSNFVFGVSLILEGGYNFTDIISLGLFIRPAYIFNDLTISYDLSTIFSMPNFQMASGLSINISF